MPRFTAILVALAALVAACGIEQADIQAETPPLARRDFGTTPADSNEFLFDPRGLNLVVGFNRPFDAGEITFAHLVPRPVEMGEILAPGPNPREVLIRGVVLDTLYTAYRLVLDGPTMLQPEILSYYSAKKDLAGGAMQGEIRITRGNDEPVDALVYALVPPGLEGDFWLSGSEETLLGQPIVGITKTLTSEGWYYLAGLEIPLRYMVVAILDTNEDGEYDLFEDWWGYFRDAVDAVVEVRAGSPLGALADPPINPMPTDIDFSLQPPGALDPGFGYDD